MAKATRASTLVPHINPKQSNAGTPTLKWKWRYETPESYAGPKIKARGKLITDTDIDGDGFVNILGIKGKRNGNKITGLYPAGTSIPGNSPYAGDNLIAYDKTTQSPQLTGDGLQFSVEGGGYSNIFFADFLQPQAYLEFHSVPPYPEGAVEPNSETRVLFQASPISVPRHFPSGGWFAASLGKKGRGNASFAGKNGKVMTISPFDYNSYIGDPAITYLQGIKGWGLPGTFLLVGANNSPGPNPQGFAYVGPLNSVANPAFSGSSGSGTWYPISVPTSFGAAGTSVYGPDKLSAGLVNYVGAYTRDLGGASPSSSNPSIVGFTYTGVVDGSTMSGYRSVQGVTDEGLDGTYTFVHSVDGGLAVGNTDLAALDGRTGYFSLKSTPFIVSLADGSQTPIRFASNDMDDSDLITHTAYGIWHNGNSSYTIAGGSGAVLEGGNGVTVGSGYLLDYDSITGQFSRYAEFNYQNRSSGDFVTHFEGIYRDVDGNYWLPATSVALNPQGDLSIASVAKVERSRSGDFQTKAEWRPLQVRESATGVESVLSTGNSLFGNTIVGFANYPTSGNGVTQADFVIQGNWLSQSLI